MLLRHDKYCQLVWAGVRRDFATHTQPCKIFRLNCNFEMKSLLKKYIF